jgi:hypothetical protein
MADESASNPQVEGTTANPVVPRYDWLRWAIRITGIALMLGGTVYLGMSVCRLLTDNKAGDGIFSVVASLVTLGLVIFVLRVGYNMLRAINRRTISSFSFVFSLVYTFILIEILPATGVMFDYPALVYLFIFLYFGLSYWMLKSILLLLLLPRD